MPTYVRPCDVEAARSAILRLTQLVPYTPFEFTDQYAIVDFLLRPTRVELRPLLVEVKRRYINSTTHKTLWLTAAKFDLSVRWAREQQAHYVILYVMNDGDFCYVYDAADDASGDLKRYWHRATGRPTEVCVEIPTTKLCKLPTSRMTS